MGKALHEFGLLIPFGAGQGGSRFETIGDIIYAFAMGCVSIVLVAFSVQDLARGESDKELHIPAVIAVSIAFGESYFSPPQRRDLP